MPEEYSVGARWWRVDFHAHSPSSYDFGAEEGSVSSDRPTVEEWLLSYMASDIDALVITDHNSHDGIDLARAGLNALRAQGGADFRELHLFPGVELTTPGGIHLLAVFDPAEDSDTINGLLHKSGFLGERGTSSLTTEKSFTEVVRLITEAGGLPIPAHVDTRAGLLGMAANELAGIESEKLVSIVEYTSEDLSRLAGRSWIPVLGSDAHHLDASGAPDPAMAKYPGSHFTWVKMSVPNLAGLRAAFSDGETSLIRSVTSTIDPNVISHSAIRSIHIKHAGAESHYEFGTWMNALIGGRGTGKSTLIEVVRLVMDRHRELPEALKGDLGWFSPLNAKSEGLRFWDDSTEIEIEYARPTGLYRITWTGTDPDARSIQFRSDSDWTPEDGAVYERFPVLISSQKQIFELSKDPQALLTLVDSLPDVDYAGWERGYEELRTSYRTVRSSITGLRQQLADESAIRGNLIDAEERVNALSEIRDSPEARELDSLLTEQKARAEHDQAAVDLSDEVRVAIERFDSVMGGVSLADPLEEIELKWRELVVKSASEIRTAGSALAEGIEAYKASDGDWNPVGERIRELREILNSSGDVADQVELSQPVAGDTDLQSQPPSQLDPFETALERRDEIRRAIANLDQVKTELASLEERAEAILADVLQSRSELFERRTRALAGLSGTTIDLKLYSFADTADLETSLRAIAQRPNGFDAIFEDDGLRRVLQRNPRHPSYRSDLATLKTVMKELRTEGESAALQALPGRAVDQRFITHIQAIDEFEYEVAIDLWWPEDHLEVRYSDSPGEAKKPINLGSPGQRTAALLAVMLRLGDQPLLLDQPEDDIDNLLIYELVVRTLKEAKSHRQVIIATHNANIVVNGDAEHVTILENGELPKVVSAGAIQVDTVRDLICQVMEGGQTAFQARYRRLLD